MSTAFYLEEGLILVLCLQLWATFNRSGLLPPFPLSFAALRILRLV